jgi:hypothetical protein
MNWDDTVNLIRLRDGYGKAAADMTPSRPRTGRRSTTAANRSTPQASLLRSVLLGSACLARRCATPTSPLTRNTAVTAYLRSL